MVDGEIDMASAPGLEAALTTHIQARTGDVRVGLRGHDVHRLDRGWWLVRSPDNSTRRTVGWMVTELQANCGTVFVLTGVDVLIHLDD